MVRKHRRVSAEAACRRGKVRFACALASILVSAAVFVGAGQPMIGAAYAAAGAQATSQPAVNTADVPDGEPNAATGEEAPSADATDEPVEQSDAAAQLAARPLPITAYRAEESDAAAAWVAVAEPDAKLAAFTAKLGVLFQRYQTLGATLCLVENGAVTAVFCYGDVDRAGTPVTPDTMFRVGSISKMIAAMGVMQLVEQGLLTLDGDLSDVLAVPFRNPEYPDTPITLRQVLSHTAGLRDGGFYSAALDGDAQPLDALFTSAGARYAFQAQSAPGTQSRYSNFGGGLLGSVIEAVTGETVDAYLTRALFAPLGVTAAFHTGLLPQNAVVSDMYAMPSRALASVVRETTVPPATPQPLCDYTLTAGKLTISAPGLGRLVAALCDGGVYGNTRVLRESSVAQMLTAQNQLGSVTCESGRGLCVNILSDVIVAGKTLYGHGGKANGMLCAAYFDPADRTGVVMLTNGCNNRATYQYVGKLTVRALQLCYTDWLNPTHVVEDPWLVETAP